MLTSDKEFVILRYHDDWIGLRFRPTADASQAF